MAAAWPASAGRFAALLAGLFFLLPVPPAAAQSDDFTDGTDEGWTRFDPIGAILGSEYASWQVQSGLYRLQCDPTPDPQLGPARLGSFRLDTVLEDFVMVVEVMSWDDSLDQAFGLLARVQPDPAPGAVNGYSLNYQPVNHNIELNRLVNEAPVNLLRVPLSLPPGEACRFVFIGRGDQLEAAVFTLAEPMKPLITLSVTDATYTSGHGGLFAFDASDAGRVDVTFDSYEAGPPTVPSLEAALNAEGALEMVWPRLGAAWHLEESPDLAVWTDVLAGGRTSAGKLAWSTAPQGRRFYRLAAGWAQMPEPHPENHGQP